MKLLFALLGLFLLAGARAQQDVDLEGLREIMHRLVSDGRPVTSESLTAVTQSFTGVEKELLGRYAQQLEDAKEAEELYMLDEILDLEIFQSLLYNLKGLGVPVPVKVAEALLIVIDGPAKGLLEQTVAGWKKAGSTVSLTDAFRNSINAVIAAIRQVLSSAADGNIRQILKTKIASLPAGMTKTVLTGIDKALDQLQTEQGSFTFVMEPDQELVLPAGEIQTDIDLVDKVLNREIVQFVSNSMKKLNKAQSREQVQILLRKVYDNKDLPLVLEAILLALK